MERSEGIEILKLSVTLSILLFSDIEVLEKSGKKECKVERLES